MSAAQAPPKSLLHAYKNNVNVINSCSLLTLGLAQFGETMHMNMDSQYRQALHT